MKRMKSEELYLFPPEEMESSKREPESDEERLVKGYIAALDLLDTLDDIKTRQVWEECKDTSINLQTQTVYLRTMPGIRFDSILYVAFEDCLLSRVFPSRPPRITVPFAYDEAVRRRQMKREE